MKRIKLSLILSLICVIGFADIVDYLEGLEIPAWKEDNTTFLIDHRTEYENKSVRTYALEFDLKTNHSRWVAFKFDETTRGGKASRSNNFENDPDLPAENQIGTSAFDTGYDRGHLCASNDRRYSDDANAQTFYMSNMSPQMTRFNEYYWRTIESRIQDLGNNPEFSTNLYVVKGGTIDNTIGVMQRSKNSTVIPAYYFVALLQECINTEGKKGYRALGFYVPHTDCADISADNLVSTIQSQVCNIDYLEQQTGIDFFPSLPDDVEDLIESKSITSSVLCDWGFDVTPDYKTDPDNLIYHQDDLRYDITLIDKGEYFQTLALPFGENLYNATCSIVPTTDDGYEFAGWATSMRTDFPEFVNRREISSKPDTLYAIYKRNINGYIYNKVVTPKSDWTGNYLIAYENDNKLLNGALDSIDVPKNFVQLDTIEGNSIPSNAFTDGCMFAIKHFEDGYSIMSKVGKYINRVTNTNGLDYTDTPSANTISLENGNVFIKGKGGYYLQYYPVVVAGGQRFRYYDNTQKPLQLYQHENASVEIYGLGIARSREATMTDAHWATYCNEFETIIPDGIKAFYATINGNTVNLHRIDSQIIPAGMGVLLYSDNAGSYKFIESYTNAKPNIDNKLIGVTTNTEIGYDKCDYILVDFAGNASFVRAEKSTLESGKCYLRLDAPSAMSKIDIVCHDNPTGIIISSASINDNESRYNLNGQIVSPSYKGIVIINGKKHLLQ